MVLCAHNPRYAWWSGYNITYQAWKDFTSTLPNAEAIIGDGNRAASYSGAYIEWRLRLPKEDIKSTPKHRYVYASEEARVNEDLTTEERITHIFFPLRSVNYTGEEQVQEEHPDSRIICQERETDRANLDRFLVFLKNDNRRVDESQISFGWLKEIRAEDDYRDW